MTAPGYIARRLPKPEITEIAEVNCSADVAATEGRGGPEFDRGAALVLSGDYFDALDVLRLVLQREPQHAGALQLAAASSYAVRRYGDAVRFGRQALELLPPGGNLPLALQSVAGSLMKLGRAREAADFLRELFAIAPDSAAVRYTRAHCCWHLGQEAEARKWIARADAMPSPTLHDTADRLAWDILLGDPVAAQCAYGRWQRRVRRWTPPVGEWMGEVAPGKTLLIRLDGGYGDMLQQATYLPSIVPKVGRVILAVPRELVALFRSSYAATYPSVEVVEWSVSSSRAFEPAHDLEIESAALVLVMDTAPTGVPTLAVPAGAAPLALGPGRHVGLSWAASDVLSDPENVCSRSAPLAALLEPLLALGDVTVHSLQVGPTTSIAAQVDAYPTVRRWMFPNFTDTARVCKALDVVVSIDAVICHVAAGVGTPTLTLLSVDCDARWGWVRSSTAWYNSMRLVRQARPGDWTELGTRAAAMIRQGDLPPRCWAGEAP